MGFITEARHCLNAYGLDSEPHLHPHHERQHDDAPRGKLLEVRKEAVGELEKEREAGTLSIYNRGGAKHTKRHELKGRPYAMCGVWHGTSMQ